MRVWVALVAFLSCSAFAADSGIGITLNGVPIGTASVLNFVAGTGSLVIGSMSGGVITLEPAADTAFLLSQQTAQAGSPWLCQSTNGTLAYTCSMMPVLTTYTTGMVVNLIPDTASVTGSNISLNIDALGPVTVKLADGQTQPITGTFLPGHLYQVWYDLTHTVFRLVGN